MRPRNATAPERYRHVAADLYARRPMSGAAWRCDACGISAGETAQGGMCELACGGRMLPTRRIREITAPDVERAVWAVTRETSTPTVADIVAELALDPDTLSDTATDTELAVADDIDTAAREWIYTAGDEAEMRDLRASAVLDAIPGVSRITAKLARDAEIRALARHVAARRAGLAAIRAARDVAEDAGDIARRDALDDACQLMEE